MPADIFDEHSWRYEAMVDWPKRLANEAPFYRKLFADVQANRVLDAACGTGHHAEMFHSWGLSVEGADISEGMVERCRARLGASDRLRWVVRPFDRPAEPGGTFDVVLCVGNSLSLASDMDTVRRAIQAMLDSARPGGLCVIHVLNTWSLPDGPMVWQKTLRTRYDGRDHLLLKGIHRSGTNTRIEVLDLTLDQPSLERWSESTPLLSIAPEGLVSFAKAAGASQVETFGDYRRTPYDRTTSPDLIAICHK
ncbi:MAG: class I SAM-dependent methyltransferase [Planctomycetes bacterium]|nr:class I SAM-dependent methyltransferase [Planctomycetota bacterium]